MNSGLSELSGNCQAGHSCGEPATFRGQAVEAAGPSPARKDLVACASHLGGMVLALSAWVHEERLRDAEITVLAIDSMASHATAGTEAGGFAFITFRIASDSPR
jgi:hypothetical protein